MKKRFAAALLMVGCCTGITFGQNLGLGPADFSKAISLSRLTQPGGTPFHLKAVVDEPGNRQTDYKAQIEEYWVAPDKWRRTVKSPEFSQTTVVNGSDEYEQTTGSYYPWWLRDAVTALFEIAPPDFVPKEIKRPENVMDASNLNLPSRSSGGAGPRASSPFRSSVSCNRTQETAGIAPVKNHIFTNMCVNDQQLLTQLNTPYFNAVFYDFLPFQRKQVARRMGVFAEAGVVLELKVTELSELKKPDDALFVIQQPTPEKDRVYSVRTREEDARNLLIGSPEIAWSPVHEGKTSGVLSIAVYVDKDGNVRETHPLNSDNPFATDQARKAVAKWHFKPQQREGVPVQMETILTFPFNVEVVDPVPLLSNAEARKLATSHPEVKFIQTKYPKGTEIVVRVAVDEHGKITRVDNVNKVDEGAFQGALSALAMWAFKPYKVNGKTQKFNADIAFVVD